MSLVTVIDYGLGNLHSVTQALSHIGARVLVAESGETLDRAERLILPGVGAFSDGMSGLARRGHVAAIRAAASRGVPLLGICLGMQLLFDESEEFGRCHGLALIPGVVTRIAAQSVKVPHVGWNRLHPPAGALWAASPLSTVPPGTWAYFVHSFHAQPRDEDDLLAVTQYGPHVLAAAVRRGSVIGFQYHPEKSGEAGLEMLRSFCFA